MKTASPAHSRKSVEIAMYPSSKKTLGLTSPTAPAPPVIGIPLDRRPSSAARTVAENGARSEGELRRGEEREHCDDLRESVFDARCERGV